MRGESHTLIATLLGVVNQWRRREGWSRETVVQHIVEAHSRIEGPMVTGIRFDPQTTDTAERMKVNADRVFRWLDDATKDANLLPANFIPSVLAALPSDLKVQALGDVLSPLGISVRLISEDRGPKLEVLDLLRTLMKEHGEAHQAVAGLVDGATEKELQDAQRELTEALAATTRGLQMIEQLRLGLGRG